MPEPKKKDKYVLLDDDSECETEEFNKMKMSWMDTRSVKDGKKYTTCRAGRCSAWCQPQWICHTIFIFVLLVSQVFLFLYVLRQQWELEILKLERGVSKPQEAIHQFDKQLYNEINKVEGNANIASDPEEPHDKVSPSVSQNKTLANGEPAEAQVYNLQEIQALDKKVNIMQGSIIHIRENLNLMQAKCEELTRNVEDKSTNNQEFSRLYKLVWKLNVSTVSSTLEIKDEIHELRNLTAELTQQFRSMETNLHSLRDLTNTQVTELEQFEESLERMHNVSENLKSHQSQLEQDLDSNFQQISQLKDEIYQKEDALNQTSQPSATMAQLQIESTPYTLPQQLESSKVTSLMSHEVDGKLDVQTPPTENTSLKSVLRNIISIPSITNLKDWTGHGYLTYRDLVNTLGRWAPTEENIKQFDENNDDRFSYTEMIKALGLQE
ncbi:epidermal growth factor receptor substrate 15-like 1 isoform X2 [Stegostoma tigrinum]|uniref:epidermal growth factor receptor substrate 15-like 1 isoform X2 n=1 Tax=Stegostoma tigrinum TaxID=3053191 RepID=UPI00286FD835|nr:epidermal growth factor receptor substrate 15-like 1 isoform X2 [Stegostoma tigrinum]